MEVKWIVNGFESFCQTIGGSYRTHDAIGPNHSVEHREPVEIIIKHFSHEGFVIHEFLKVPEKLNRGVGEEALNGLIVAGGMHTVGLKNDSYTPIGSRQEVN